MIQYEIVPLSPESHIFEVQLNLADPKSTGQILYLPAWIRGSYMIRDFARHIISFKAQSGGKPIDAEKIDKHSWRLAPCSGPLQLTYTVYAWDLSVRGAHLDITHAYFNGPCVFLAVQGRENEACELQIHAPQNQACKNWQVATGMPTREVDAKGFGAYLAPDYEALLDHPVEMAELDVTSFTVNHKQHLFVVRGRHSGDLTRLCQDLEKVCAQHVELFGELPINSYLFLLWVVGEGYGGLEHQNSTSLMCSRDDLPGSDMNGVTEGYRRLLGLCSHEYFHLWNVKRIMPAVFQSEGTEREVYTRQLWVFEGITSYYDELALVRSGVIDRKNYFELLAETITRVMRGSGRNKQTLEESSFDAWTKFYKQDENAPNAIVSYYAKGALFALMLDLHIRLETANERSLDDIMRYVWQHYGKTGQGLAEREFEQVAAEVTGLDLEAFFNMGVRSTQDLPLKKLLSEFGVEMYLQPAQSSSDKGQVIGKTPGAVNAKQVLGARTSQQNQEIKLTQVFDNGAAQIAGLSAGDTIAAVDGLRLNEKQLEQRIASTAGGESLTIHAFRRDELMVFNLIPKPAPLDTCTIHLPINITQKRQSMLDAWLHVNENQD